MEALIVLAVIGLAGLVMKAKGNLPAWQDAKGATLNVILQEKLPDGTFKLYRQDAPDPPLVAVK